MNSINDTDELGEHVAAIHRLGKAKLDDILQIGDHLIAIKNIVGHGNFGALLDKEFHWSQRTARKFMELSRLAKTENFADLPIPISSLYELAAPSTPAEVRDEVFKKAREIRLKHDEVAALIRKGRVDRRNLFELDTRRNDHETPEQRWTREMLCKIEYAIDLALGGGWLRHLYPDWKSYAVSDELAAKARTAAIRWNETADIFEQRAKGPRVEATE